MFQINKAFSLFSRFILNRSQSATAIAPTLNYQTYTVHTASKHGRAANPPHTRHNEYTICYTVTVCTPPLSFTVKTINAFSLRCLSIIFNSELESMGGHFIHIVLFYKPQNDTKRIFIGYFTSWSARSQSQNERTEENHTLWHVSEETKK